MLLGIAFVVVLLVALMTKKETLETFLSVLLIEDKLTMDLVVPPGEYSRSLEGLTKKTPKKFRIVERQETPQALQYTNAADLRPTDRVIACTDDISTACFVKGFFSPMSGEDVSELPGFRVGYIQHPRDEHVLRALLTSCGVNPTTIGLVKLTTPAQALAELEKPQAVDAVFLLANLENPAYKGITDLKLSVLSMARLNKDIAHMLLPHAVLQDVDIRKRFTNINHPTRPIRVVADFNNVLIRASGGTNEHTYLHDLVAAYFEHNQEYLNHFGRTTSTSATEAFEDIVTFVPQHNVPGYFDHMTNVFETPIRVLDGTPLQKGDLVVLKHQDRTHEQGYFVVEATGEEKTLLRRRHADGQPRDPEKDDKFFCVTDRSIKFRDECLSTTDRYGRAKSRVDVWDAPCVVSEECPFYQRNRNYKNYRGGCADGYCEMPLGVQRVGFKNYIGRAICHNCPLDKLDCCKDQMRPDYAFPRDEFEREAQRALE
jgi:hypothetical protein